MIKSFADKDTEQLFSRKAARKIPSNIQRVALRKLLQLHAAVELEFLKVPPGNSSNHLRVIVLGSIVFA
ncbi:MAG TPA: hypothetical protein VFM18_11255 [Methanosarcina sp.]|nr:hypothetical protein [Methanosarcina sp.]